MKKQKLQIFDTIKYTLAGVIMGFSLLILVKLLIPFLYYLVGFVILLFLIGVFIFSFIYYRRKLEKDLIAVLAALGICAVTLLVFKGFYNTIPVLSSEESISEEVEEKDSTERIKEMEEKLHKRLDSLNLN